MLKEKQNHARLFLFLNYFIFSTCLDQFSFRLFQYYFHDILSSAYFFSTLTFSKLNGFGPDQDRPSVAASRQRRVKTHQLTVYISQQWSYDPYSKFNIFKKNHVSRALNFMSAF